MTATRPTASSSSSSTTEAQTLAIQEKAEKAKKTFSTLQPVLDKKQIKQLTAAMATEVHATLKGKAPLVLTIYPEGAHFSNTLTKNLGDLGLILEENYIDLRIQNDEVSLLVEPLVSLEGRTVLITDTLLKDGQTMEAALAYCKAKGARELYCATLVNMPTARLHKLQGLQPNFFGLESTPLSLVGFGLAAEGYFRNEPGLWAYPEAPASSAKSTGSILATLQSNRRPLLLQEQIKANEAALANAQKAETTFTKLDLLLNKKQLKEKIKLTAEAIKARFKDTYPVVLSMQKGGSHFTTYLTEHLAGMPIEESYMHITRYGNSQQGGQAKVISPSLVDLKGRTVIISEDLIEGGLTIKMARELCLEQGAAAVYVVALGDKPSKRLKGLENIKADYYCFEFDDRFLVGTGLDEQENLRNVFGVWAHPKTQEKPINETKPSVELTNKL